MPTIARSIVVMGASNGGVEALTTVLADLPADLPAAVFVVLHLPPGLPSRLAELLDRASPLRVEQAVDGAEFLPGRVYVAPPDRHLVLAANRIRLDDGAAQNRSRPSIDALFRSAAVQHGCAVIGVVLSGQQDDGSQGLAAVTRCGGIGIVQEPDDARFPQMPASAIAADDPQFVVPLREIAGRIVDAVGTPGTPVEIPFALQLEALADARLGPSEVYAVDGFGDRAALTCPDCGGPLWEIEGQTPHFRCMVGHAFSDGIMFTAKAEESMRALWVAVRMLDEQVRMMMNSSQRPGATPAIAARFASRGAELTEAGRVLRAMIEQIGARWVAPQLDRT